MSAILTSEFSADTDAGLETPTKPKILVVDDCLTVRVYIEALLEYAGAYEIFSAGDGCEALTVLEENPSIQLVVTDLHMPNMDGLELVREVRSNHPLIAVILVTSQGSETVAVEALQNGAASYVAKDCMERDLGETVERVLSSSRSDRRRQKVLESVAEMDCRFEFENDPALVPLFVSHIQEYLMRMGLCDLNSRIRIGVALEESLLNGMYHGNLELSSDLRQDGGDAFERLAATRRHLAPYRDRKLHVQVRIHSTEAVFVIRDEGPGFDVANLPDPTDPENMLKASGRGLLLIRTFMDEVTHNESGNQITMVRRRKN